MILSGHPSGNPNSHQAFRAFAEASLLYGVCLPWAPSEAAVNFFSRIPYLRPAASRLKRRRLDLGAGVKTFQGRKGEFRRLCLRYFGCSSEALSYEANDWLMRQMSHRMDNPSVTAVHSYEDCSFLQFEKAKQSGKACIYDMPIGYYPAWQRLSKDLAIRFSDWIPPEKAILSSFARPEQKASEMSLSDLVITPSEFVARTVHELHPTKHIEIARYGIDVNFWHPKPRIGQRTLTFIFAGQCSVRKGVPLLIEAWERAGLKNARLLLIGGWQLKKEKLRCLPSNVTWSGPTDPISLRQAFWDADCLVAPTYFEGRALVIGEAMATGLPVISTPSSGCEDLVGNGCGIVFPTGDFDALVEALRDVEKRKDKFLEIRAEARRRAEINTWDAYRTALTRAVHRFI